MKKVFCFILTFALFICLFPLHVFAEPQNDYVADFNDAKSNDIKNHAVLDTQSHMQLLAIGDIMRQENEPENDYSETAGVVYHNYTIVGTVGGYDLDWNYFTLSQTSEIFLMMQSKRSGPDFAIIDGYADEILYVSMDNWYNDGYYYDLITCTLTPGEYHILILDMDESYYVDYMYYFEATPTGYSSHTHNYDYYIVQPTCTNDGYTYYECSCGDSYIDETTPAYGHTIVTNPAIQPTCTTAGITEGKYCSICNTVIISQQSISSTGHIYAHKYDYNCDNCGQLRSVDMTRPMVDMFRMYNPNTGEHFYTGSNVEKDNLIAVGWQYEGVGFTFPLTTGLPVYRLFQPSTGEHLYTMDEAEKAKLMAEGWNFEGIAFNSGFENEVPQYRLHNPNANVGAYHFTASEIEKNNLIAAGWEYQGIGWYSLGA